MALPSEMIDEILCQLSAKNLLRCRCVSKEWSALLLSRSILRLVVIAMLILEGCFLLNPIMRKSKKIAPVPPDQFPSSFRRKERHIYGFGYDEVNDDYKIQNVPKNIHFTGTRGVFASGLVHWLAFENRSNSKDIIFGFDLELEQFKEVPFPPIDMTRDSSKSRFLADIGEYLCILDRPSYQVDVWLMNYPGAESAWYKALCTGQGEIHGTMRSNELIVFSRSGKDLLLQVCNPYNTKLAWYNLDREIVKNVGIRGLPFNFVPFLYTESLLQLTENEPLQQKPSEDKQKKIQIKGEGGYLDRNGKSYITFMEVDNVFYVAQHYQINVLTTIKFFKFYIYASQQSALVNHHMIMFWVLRKATI
ncbi:hypothetical protein POM88_011572 [Heracleum sosnowskyi]|uniref:F-box domain-containing protein n=1 Tax=Heracleum sosnowskyi TaxID=360622 RepID=A0AAD8IXA0_9APIA|nr:hypothetical protein POM88_011572 [Heracleum sosnowskyi]